MKTNVKIAVGLVAVVLAVVVVRHYFPLFPCPPLTCR